MPTQTFWCIQITKGYTEANKIFSMSADNKAQVKSAQ